MIKIPQTDIHWPEVLSCFGRGGYSLQALPTFERTGLASGRSIPRRLFSFVPSRVRIKMRLDGVEAMAFETFFRDDLNDGVKWFNIKLKTTRSNNDDVVACFEEMYEGPKFVDDSIDLWDFSFTMLLFERPLIPEPWGTRPDFIGNAPRFDALMNWVWPKWRVKEVQLDDFLIYVSNAKDTEFLVNDWLYEALRLIGPSTLAVTSNTGVSKPNPPLTIDGVKITLTEPLKLGDKVYFTGKIEVYEYDS